MIGFAPSDAGRRASARLGFLRAERSGRAFALAALRAVVNFLAAVIVVELLLDLRRLP